MGNVPTSSNKKVNDWEITMNDEDYREFVKLLQKHEAALRCFVRSLLPSWNDVDDIMQEISLVLWEKFSDFDQNTNFLKWAYVIARFKVMNFSSKKGREKLCFDNDLLELMASECIEEFDERERENEAMHKCMSKFPEGRQKLLINSCHKEITIKELAETIGKSPTALYKTLNRLRLALYNCIREELKEDGLR
jgi:RNA polymerase sigma-70 factor, ECF subfamily